MMCKPLMIIAWLITGRRVRMNDVLELRGIHPNRIIIISYEARSFKIIE